MGKCTITFEDDGDGVRCDFVFDPPLDLENNNATPAQHVALEKWQMLQRMAEEDEESP